MSAEQMWPLHLSSISSLTSGLFPALFLVCVRVVCVGVGGYALKLRQDEVQESP